MCSLRNRQRKDFALIKRMRSARAASDQSVRILYPSFFFFLSFFLLLLFAWLNPNRTISDIFSYIVLTYLPKTTRRCSFWSSSNARAATVLHTSLRRRIPCVRGILKVTFLFWEPKVDMSAYQAQAQANSQNAPSPLDVQQTQVQYEQCSTSPWYWVP